MKIDDIIEKNYHEEFLEDNVDEYITENEGLNIKDDIKTLEDMGYDKKMINKVYILLQPQNIERAIEYMTEIDDIIQHDFIENHNPGKNKDLCFICEKPKKFHLDFIPEEFLLGNNNLNNNTININNTNNNLINDINIDVNNDEDYNFFLMIMKMKKKKKKKGKKRMII